MSNPLKELMPGIYKHEGAWEGTYRHVSLNGETLDVHKSQVECIFPDSGEVIYIQKNAFAWDDGRRYENEFSGILRNNKIYWDTPTFSGFGWMGGDIIFLLELDRKDEIGASFHEAIVLGSTGKHRARTWHWFKDGQCYKRTLCDEHLINQ